MSEFFDATAMAQAVAEGQVSSRELVEAAIETIERENPALVAVVHKQYQEARQEALQGDWQGKPFGGVPILLKDLGQNQKGQPSSAGSRLLTDYVAKRSDNYVKAIQAAGFIILGRTNTPEFGFKNISDAAIHGVTKTPLDRTRHAGGSSGGSAAAIAAGMVPLAGASDGGGSIRIPASFNGLIGLKPSRGRIPLGPGSYRGWQGASVNFALTKSIRDTKRLLQAMQVTQWESPYTLPVVDFSQAKQKSSLKIGVITSSPVGTPVSDQAKDMVDKAAKALEEMGHQVTYLDQWPVDGIQVMRSYYLMNSVETASMFKDMEAGFGRSFTLEDMELMTWAIYRSGLGVEAHDFVSSMQQWDQWSRIMHEWHQDYDLLLSPAAAQVAPGLEDLTLSRDLQARLAHMDAYQTSQQQDLIWEMFQDSLAVTPFTQLANITGQPALSLPIKSTYPLPIGIQLIAPKGREDLLLEIGQEFEARDLLMTDKDRRQV